VSGRREDALAIFRAGVAAVDAEAATRAALDNDDGSLRPQEGGRLLLLGAGKAAMGMARGAMAVLGDRVTAGAVAVPHGAEAAAGTPWPVEIWQAGHPLPDAGSLAAATEALRLARSAGIADRVLCLLSGGASALWAAPATGLTLEHLRRVTDTLLSAGAAIEEVNRVRRHLSAIAGGRLAAAAVPAPLLTLAISDVIGSPPESIGSGPTVPDPYGFEEALEVLSRYGVDEPPAVVGHLQRGLAGELEESPKPGSLPQSHFRVIASLAEAVEGARREAERRGYRAQVVSDALTGHARAAGSEIASLALQAARAAGERRALIWGGETTVVVRGDGRGGRSQELALAAARMLQGFGGVTLLAAGTDGVDGPTPAAGAVVDGGTVARAREHGFDADAALSNNDALPLLHAAGDLLVTGPTGTNVGDLVVALLE
jgi:glycerate 2-kinase